MWVLQPIPGSGAPPLDAALGGGGGPFPHLMANAARGTGKRDAACATLFLAQLREQFDPVRMHGLW
jgi:hypothetical protein